MTETAAATVAVTFPRMGQVTFGNPNHYDGSGLMLRELRARARDTDEDAKGLDDAVAELEAGFLEEYGVKLTERTAVQYNYADLIGDMLSDQAPAGTKFGVRQWPDGNHNWGYWPESEGEGSFL
jgi:hypothetical protein